MQQYMQCGRPSSGKPMPVSSLLRATAAHPNPHITLTRDGCSPEPHTPVYQHRHQHHQHIQHHNHHHEHHHNHPDHTYGIDVHDEPRTAGNRPSQTVADTSGDVRPIMNRKEYHERLAVAEALSRTSMMTSPAARRRLAARKVEIDMMGGSEGIDEGYWDEDFDYVPPKQLLMYMVR